MKRIVSRLEPWQNAKVIGILTIFVSFWFVLPEFIDVAYFDANWHTEFDKAGNEILVEVGPPAIVYLFLPFLFGIIGAALTASTCFLYNYIYRYIGGVEFDAAEVESAATGTANGQNRPVAAGGSGVVKILSGIVAGMVIASIIYVPVMSYQIGNRYEMGRNAGRLDGLATAVRAIRNEFGVYDGKSEYKPLFSVKTSTVVAVETEEAKVIRVIP